MDDIVDAQTLVEEAENDDWGDFGDAILQLEKAEISTSEEHAPAQIETDPNEAVESLLSTVFSLTEQAISSINDIDFSFDDKGKTEVIKATVPVLNKHGSGMLGLFGDYLEEGTLLIAVLGLGVSTHLAVKKSKALVKTQPESDQGDEHGKEAA